MKKTKNPLIKRIPKELLGDWRKYLVIFLFLTLTIGFISGMYVANGSMMASAVDGITTYKLEYGHFELDRTADKDLLAGIASGEKADVYTYYIEKAKSELDEKFPEEFKEEFDSRFEEEFSAEFDQSFQEQLLQSLLLEGMDEDSARLLLSTLVQQAQEDGTYNEAYQTAYEKAYESSYNEAYSTAYDDAWETVLTEVDDEYEKAVEQFELDIDTPARTVTLYENFFRNETENTDGIVRVSPKNEDVNLACVLEGRLPEDKSEIAIDRMHADNADIAVGDTIQVGGETFQVVGLLAYVNYATLHENNSDMMFDALNFDVAMVTDEGFDRLSSPVHYNYAWQYDQSPVDEVEEKQFSDQFLKVLLTQTAIADASLEDYIPRYANSAVNFATEDMGSDMAMGGVLLYVLIAIIAFIFAVTCVNTITGEASVIGTLRASGFTKAELTAHYLAMPVAITLISAIVGNVLGYTVFVNVVTAMYYNSYSLPTYQTLWNGDAFIKTTLTPLLLMFAINLVVIVRMMRYTPLHFLRHDLKQRRQKKALRLPGWKFFSRFRIRIILQNLSNYVILFVGVLFVAIMLAMAVGMPATLHHYQTHASEMMIADYQVILRDYEDEDGNPISTETEGAEAFALYTLIHQSPSLEEEISVYGITATSEYVSISEFDELKTDEVYISESYGEKYGISVGDNVTLEEKYEHKQYHFTVAGIYDRSLSLSVFMPIDHYREIFETDSLAITGYFSAVPVNDIDDSHIATVITQQDIIKMANQLDHSMGAFMVYFQYLCILLSAVLIYLLTKIIIEKNETSISMIKILGFENREIFRLYLLSTTLVVVVADAVSTLLGVWIMSKLWRLVLADINGYFSFVNTPLDYVKIFLFIFAGYLIVLFFDFRRIGKIPLERALKNME